MPPYLPWPPPICVTSPKVAKARRGHIWSIELKTFLSGLFISAWWKTVVQNFSPQRKNSRNNPTWSPVIAAVHSNTTKRITKLQNRRHYGRLFNPLFNGRTTTLQTFIQWHQASALLFPPITNCRQSTVYQFSTLQALILRSCNPHNQKKNIFAKKTLQM
jgi:hypothetical protein